MARTAARKHTDVGCIRRQAPTDLYLREVPQAKRRPVAHSFAIDAETHAERDQAIKAAYPSGSSTICETSDFSNPHHLSISRVILAAPERGKAEAHVKTRSSQLQPQRKPNCGTERSDGPQLGFGLVALLGIGCDSPLCEVGDCDGLLSGKRSTMQFHSFDFVRGFCGHITLAAV